MEESKYSQRGVSASKDDVKSAVTNIDKGIVHNSFCKIIPDVLGDTKKPLFGPSFCNVLHSDGAGTKAVLAYLYWRETGDVSVWRGIAQDAVIMNIDDLLCVGASNNFMVSSTIARNKFRIPGEVITALVEGTQEVCDELTRNRINIFFAGGETADLGDSVRTIVVDASVAARLKRNEIISCDRIQDGDVIIGLSSVGKTIYESLYHSGIGSNGLTSARHDVLKKEYAEKYPESYDNAMPAELAYSGSKSLTDATEVKDYNIGQLLLAPTRTYAPVIKAVLDNYRPSIHGIIHNTGGGQTKVMNFVKNMHVVKNNLFETPEIMKIIQAEGHTDWREMYQVYNMGHRMEVYVKESMAKDVIDCAKFFNLDAKIIGYCENSNHNLLTIDGPYGSFTY